MTLDELIYNDLAPGFGESLASHAAKRALSVLKSATGLTDADLEAMMAKRAEVVRYDTRDGWLIIRERIEAHMKEVHEEQIRELREADAP